VFPGLLIADRRFLIKLVRRGFACSVHELAGLTCKFGQFSFKKALKLAEREVSARSASPDAALSSAHAVAFR